MKLELFKKKTRSEYILYSVIIAVGIILDQLTKWLSVTFLKKMTTLPLIKGVLHLTYVENRGAAFGMLADNRWVFMITSTVMIIVLSLYLYLAITKVVSSRLPNIAAHRTLLWVCRENTLFL